MRQIYRCTSAVFLCFINPRGPEHFRPSATPDGAHTLLLVCSASLTSPLCISRPASRGPRLSVTSIISSRLNVHSIKTRFTAPAILLGGAMGRLSCGFEERKDGGLAGEGSCELCGREASCVGRDLCARCAPVRTRRCSHTPQPTSCFSCPFIS